MTAETKRKLLESAYHDPFDELFQIVEAKERDDNRVQSSPPNPEVQEGKIEMTLKKKELSIIVEEIRS